MRNSVLLLVCGMILSTSVFAQRGPGPGWGRTRPDPRPWEQPHAPGPGQRYIDRGSRMWVPADVQACGVTHIRYAVYNDTLMIKQLDLLFNNNQTQTMEVKQIVKPAAPGMPQPAWQAIQAWSACVDGIYLDAFPERDGDRQDAYVVIYGWTNYGQELQLATVRVKEWNERRGWRPPGRPGPVAPGPVQPPTPVAPGPGHGGGHQPPMAPTMGWLDRRITNVPKFISTTQNVDVSHDAVTEVYIKAEKNSVTIQSATYTDARTGVSYPIPGLQGLLSENAEKQVRLAAWPVAVSKITITATNDLRGSQADIVVKIGITRPR